MKNPMQAFVGVDFDDIFTYVREMEYLIGSLMKHKNGDLPMLGNLRDNDKSRKVLHQLQTIITEP